MIGPVRLGIVTPIVSLVPGAHARWEREGTVQDLVEVARAADRLGYDHLTCSEHTAVPTAVAATRGATYWDPVATLAHLAAHTERIRLATSVVVLGYHHPLELAKRYGTLDLLSGGRLVLGVGVGSLEEEFDLLGAPFADRGDRADDALAALRVALSSPEPVFHGRYVDFEGFTVAPGPVQRPVPIWVGGRTARSLRRAVTLADGWCPFGLEVDDLARLLAGARATPAWAERTEGFDLVLQPTRALDPLGNPDGARATAERLAGVGATVLSLRLVHRSRDHLVEQLAAMADLVGPA
jgi:probable F420-dependent oxidoreductase